MVPKGDIPGGGGLGLSNWRREKFENSILMSCPRRGVREFFILTESIIRIIQF